MITFKLYCNLILHAIDNLFNDQCTFGSIEISNLSWLKYFLSSADIIVVECTVLFQEWVLRLVFGDLYDFDWIKVNPSEQGVPSNRMRKYMFLVKKTSRKWNPKIKENFDAAFKHFFNQTCILKSTEYLPVCRFSTITAYLQWVQIFFQQTSVFAFSSFLISFM